MHLCDKPFCRRGRWKTPDELAQIIHKKRPWTRAHLKDWSEFGISLPHQHHGRRTSYFPPCIALVLKAEGNRYEPADDWLTQHEIAQHFDITWRIAEKLLAQFVQWSKPRRDKRNRIRRHYPPFVIAKLEPLAAAYSR